LESPGDCGKEKRHIAPFLAKGLRESLVILLLLHLLTVAAMAASPAFHEWLHHDSDQEDHDCAVTLFLSGGVEEVLQPLLQIERIAVLDRELEMLAPAAHHAVQARTGILEHAPPAGLVG